MTWFRSFRADHGFTFYGDQPSPESLDKQLVAVVYVCVLLSGATLIATLGIRGREKWSHAVRASYAVAIASSILLCLMSHNWMEGRVNVKAPFVYRSNMHFSGSLSVQIGLKSANITLDGIYMSPSGGKNVYYVETLPWPKYGSERQCYQHQLQRGLPGPVLRVMDFLTYQHGELQWGKSYHTAGQYAWALLWTSFVFWILANLLLFSVVIYGAYMFFLAGVSLLMACVAYSQCLNPQPLHMTFGPDVLQLEYGWSFWLAIVAGCLTTLLGVLLIVTDYFLHTKVAEFFHLEKMVEEEDSSAKDDGSYPNKPRFYTDARGSLASTTQGDNSRRGSIFLEPSRQTKWMVNPFGVPPGKGNPFGSHNGGGGGGGVGVGFANGGFEHHDSGKFNPLYNDGSDVTSNEEINQNGNNNNNNNLNRSPFRLNARSKSESFLSSHGDTGNQPYQHQQYNRRLCHSRMSVSNDRKPSLATLKEHRENHVNEQRFNSSQANNGSSQASNGSSQASNSSCPSSRASNSSDSTSRSPHSYNNATTRTSSPRGARVHSLAISRSLNDVNALGSGYDGSGSSQQQQRHQHQQQQHRRQSDNFINEAARSIRQRSSAPIVLEDNDSGDGGNHRNNNGGSAFVGSGGGGSGSGSETIVEVVVENHRGGGGERFDDNDKDNNEEEKEEDETMTRQDRQCVYSPRENVDFGKEKKDATMNVGSVLNHDNNYVFEDENFELRKKHKKSCDCTTSTTTSTNGGVGGSRSSSSSSSDGGRRREMYRNSNQTSTGSGGGGGGGSSEDDAVFTGSRRSYSFSSSRQASEGEAGEEVTSSFTLGGEDDVVAMTEFMNGNGKQTSKRISAVDPDRHVSISMGAI